MTGDISGLVKDRVYSVKWEVLRSDLGQEPEKLKWLKLNGKSFGECNPPGGDYDCDFYPCNDGTDTITPDVNGRIRLEAEYIGHSSDCKCDQNNLNGNCKDERISVPDDWVPTVAAIKFTLTLTPQIYKVIYVNNNTSNLSGTITGLQKNKQYSVTWEILRSDLNHSQKN